MPAGHDFNALLIGALYGELSAVEESRLQAHLAAHPGDHELLRELTRTREAIRASAVLAIVEPPQAISARLLQEAARRVRGRTAEVDAVAPGSRWLRWFSSLMAHPGLAAAAMAVLVVGVFGTMYLRDKHELAESLLSRPSATAPSGASGSSAASPAEGVAAGSAIQSGDLDRQQLSAQSTSTGGAGQARDYNASPVAVTAREGVLEPEDSYAVDLEADGLDPALVRDAKNQDARRGLDRSDRSAQPTAPTTSPASKPASRPGYIEARSVPSDEIELKSYDDEKPRQEPAREEREAGKSDKVAKPAKSEDADPLQRRAPALEPKSAPLGKISAGDAPGVLDADDSEAERQEEKAKDSAVAKKTISGAAGTRAPSPERTVRPTKPAEASVRVTELGAGSARPGGSASGKGSPGAASSASGGPANAVTGAGKLGAAAPRAGATGSATGSARAVVAKPEPAPAPPAIAAAPVTTSSVESVSLVDDTWAKSEHVRLVRLVRANKCSEAAKVARAVAERANRYYQDRIAGTSDVRVCESAIRDQLNLSEQAKRKRNRAAPAAADEAQRK